MEILRYVSEKNAYIYIYTYNNYIIWSRSIDFLRFWGFLELRLEQFPRKWETHELSDIGKLPHLEPASYSVVHNLMRKMIRCRRKLVWNVCVCVCTCLCMWRPEVDTGMSASLVQFSASFSETEFLHWTWSSLFWLNFQAPSPGIHGPPPSVSELQRHTEPCLAFTRALRTKLSFVSICSQARCLLSSLSSPRACMP